MKLEKLYFDGKNKGRIVAVTNDGAEYEQSQVVCTDCGVTARVLKPITGSAASSKHCRCSTKN